ncbi:MAG TPA: alpha/beta hydrolase [Gaiellaceae bacterium]
MPLDPQVEALLASWAVEGAVPIEELTPEQAREDFEATATTRFGPVEEVDEVEERAAPGPVAAIPVRVYRADAGDEAAPAVVYFHGGGWVIGNLDTHDGVCRALANRVGCTVVSVDYRLAPENPFPAAVEDAWAATQWVAEHASALRVDRNRIAVSGDSAGGNLSAVVARRARDHGLPLVLQALVYPVTDHDFRTGSYLEFADSSELSRAEMEWFWNHYVPDPAARDHPDASPLRAPDLAGVAPAFVATAECDPLRDEGDAYGERLRAAGVPTTVRCYAGLAHGYNRMIAHVDAARAAFEEACEALRAALYAERFGSPSTTRS